MSVAKICINVLTFNNCKFFKLLILYTLLLLAQGSGIIRLEKLILSHLIWT